MLGICESEAACRSETRRQARRRAAPLATCCATAARASSLDALPPGPGSCARTAQRGQRNVQNSKGQGGAGATWACGAAGCSGADGPRASMGPRPGHRLHPIAANEGARGVTGSDRLRAQRPPRTARSRMTLAFGPQPARESGQPHPRWQRSDRFGCTPRPGPLACSQVPYACTRARADCPTRTAPAGAHNALPSVKRPVVEPSSPSPDARLVDVGIVDGRPFKGRGPSARRRPQGAEHGGGRRELSTAAAAGS